MCKYASSALANIAFSSDAHRDACATAGAIPALTGALTRHAGEAGVCQNASAALQNISWNSPSHRAAAGAAGAVPHLAAAWSSHPSAKNVARNALVILGYSTSGQLL